MHTLAGNMNLDLFPLVFHLQMLDIGPVVGGEAVGDMPFSRPVLMFGLWPIIFNRLLWLRKIEFIFNPACQNTLGGILMHTTITFIQIMQNSVVPS